MNSVGRLRRQYKRIINSMREEDVLDWNFELNMQLGDLGYVSECIDVYSTSTEQTIHEIGSYMQGGMINHDDMLACIFKIKGGSTCIGAYKVAEACNELLEAIEAEDSNRGMGALLNVKSEYEKVRPGFQRLVELASRISQGDQ